MDTVVFIYKYMLTSQAGRSRIISDCDWSFATPDQDSVGKANSTGQNFVPLLSQKRAGFQDAQAALVLFFECDISGRIEP